MSPAYTWASDQKMPLVLFPGTERQLVNWRFKSAIGAEWSLLGGTPPVRFTSNFKFSPACLKYSPVAATSYAEQTNTLAATPGWKNTGRLEDWYVYYFLRVDSQTGNPAFTVKPQSQTAGHAVVDNFTAQVLTVGVDIPVDSKYHIYRAGPFTPTTYASVAEMLVRAGFLASATVVAYLGGIYLGHAVDFQDQPGGPAYMVPPSYFDEREEIIKDTPTSGKVRTTETSALVPFGMFATSMFAVDAKDKWRLWWKYVKAGEQWALFRSQSDWDRDCALTATVDQMDDGLTAKPGTRLYTGQMSWVSEPGAGLTAPPETLVIKVAGMLPGAVDAYFTSSDGVTGIPGSAANVYPYLDPKRTGMSDQVIHDVTSETEFPQFNFALLDRGEAIVALLAASLRSMFQFPVTVYAGDGAAGFAALKQIFFGYITNPSQVGTDGMAFTIITGSIFEKLKQSIEIPTGRAQLYSGISSTEAGRYRCQKVAGMIQPPVNLLASAVPDESDFEAGSNGVTPQGWTTPDSPAYMFKQIPDCSPGKAHGLYACRNTRAPSFNEWKEVRRTYSNNKRGRIYQCLFSYSSYDTANDNPGQLQVIVEGLSAGLAVLESISSPVILEPASKVFRNGEGVIKVWTRGQVAFAPADPLTKNIRVRILTNNFGKLGFDLGVEVDFIELRSCQLLQCDREVMGWSAFTDLGSEAGLLDIGARALYGSLHANHYGDPTQDAASAAAEASGSEMFRFVAMRGHPLDTMRRLITTTLRSEKGAWVSGTPYLANEYTVDGIRIGAGSVTNGGLEWRCIKDTVAPHTTAPAEGVYWTAVGAFDAGDGIGLGEQIPDYFINHAQWDRERNWKSTGSPGEFADYDFSKYVFDLRVNATIDNLLQLLIDEFLKPLYANLYQDADGLLCIRMHREVEDTGSAWSNVTAYLVGDVAISGSLSWRCILAHTNQTPAEGIYWTSNEINNDDLFNGNAFFEFAYDDNDVVTEVSAQFDYDPSGKVDVEANKTDGGTKFLTQVLYNEKFFGHEDSDAQVRAEKLYGRHALEISAQAVRGLGSARFGISDNLGGDQIMRETARRILRRRHPHQVYTGVEAHLSRRTIPAGAVPRVSSDAMVNYYGTAGLYRKRVNTPMLVEKRSVGWDAGRCAFELRAVSDLAPIPNTNVAPALLAPTANEFAAYFRRSTSGAYPNTLFFLSANYDEIGMGYKQLPLWPKDTANVVWVSLYPGRTTAPAAPLVPPSAPYRKGVLSVAITAGGTGYAVNDVVTFGPVWVSGTPYFVGDHVTNASKTWRCITNTVAPHTSAPAQGTTWTQDAQAHVSAVSAGVITAVVVDNPGTWFAAAPTPVFGGAGTGATGTVTLTDRLLAVRIYAANLLIRYHAWVTGTTYAIGDLVSSGGKFWRSLTAHTDAVAPVEGGIWTEDVPTTAQYQRVCEIPFGQAEGYFLAEGCSLVPATVNGFIWLQSTWLKICYVNEDSVETSKTAFFRISMPSSPVATGFRMPQNQAKVYSTDGAIPARSTFNGNRF